MILSTTYATVIDHLSSQEWNERTLPLTDDLFTTFPTTNDNLPEHVTYLIPLLLIKGKEKESTTFFTPPYSLLNALQRKYKVVQWDHKTMLLKVGVPIPIHHLRDHPIFKELVEEQRILLASFISNNLQHYLKNEHPYAKTKQEVLDAFFIFNKPCYLLGDALYCENSTLYLSLFSYGGKGKKKRSNTYLPIAWKEDGGSVIRVKKGRWQGVEIKEQQHLLSLIPFRVGKVEMEL